MDTRQQTGRVGVAGSAHPTACITTCLPTRPARRRCWHPAPSCPHAPNTACKRSRQQCAAPQAATTDQPGQDSQPLTQLIADVLNAERAQGALQGDVLSAIDTLAGRQVVTTVSRAWEGRDAWLEVQGHFQNCPEARKFALLSVYHERLWLRNQQLERLFQLVVQHRPGFIPTAVADRVLSSIRLNGMSGATEALQLPELLQLCVCYLPLATLEDAIKQAAEQAWGQLRTQPWAAREGLGPGPLRGQLAMMVAAWRYELSTCLIRLHHLQGINATSQALAKLQQASQPTGVRSRSLWLNNTSGPLGNSTMFTSSGAPAPNTDTDAATAVANFVAGQLGAFVKEGLTGPLVGRCGYVTFGRGGPPNTASPADNSSSSSSDSKVDGNVRLGAMGDGKPARQLLADGGLARGALVRDRGCEGAAGFGAAVLREFRDVYVADRDKKAVTAQHKSVFQSAALAYEAVLRSKLMDALCAWAATQPELVPVGLNKAHCTHSTRIRSGSQDHVSRVMTIGVRGAAGSDALPWLRQQALQQGSKLLQGWDPYLGNPFNNTPEWQYRNDAPVVWNRLVYPPALLDTTRLTLFWRKPPTSPPTTTATTPAVPVAISGSASECEQVTLQLSQADLQAFMAVLLEAVPAVTSVSADGSGGRRKQSGAWLGPACLQVRYNPVTTTYPISVMSDGADSGDEGGLAAGQQPSDFEVRWLQSSIARVEGTNTKSGSEEHHSTSLQTRMEDGRDGKQQYQMARLTVSHIQSLINIYEDVSNRLPDILPVPMLPSSLTLSPYSSAPAANMGQRLVQAAVRIAGLLAFAAAVPLAMTAGSKFEWSRPAVAWVSNQASRVRGVLPIINAQQSTISYQASTQQQDTQQQQPHGVKSSQLPMQDGITTGRRNPQADKGPPAWQPLGSSKLNKQTLDRLCRLVQSRTDKLMWLPLTPLAPLDKSDAHEKVSLPSIDPATGAKSDTPAEQGYEPLQLKYQVVVARDGRILGCMPCDPNSARWYSLLPLSRAFRSLDSQQQQQRFLDACQPKAAKQQVPGSLTALGSPAMYIPLPHQASSQLSTASSGPTPEASPTTAGLAAVDEDAPQADVAVLLLSLVQDAASKALIGKGKNAKECAPMVAQVTTWTDLDSAATWASKKAVVISRKKPRKSQDSVTVTTHNGSTSTTTKIQLPVGGSPMGGVVGQQGQGQGSGSNTQGGMSQVEQLLQHAIRQLAEQAAQQQQQGEGATGGQSSGSNK